MQIKAGSGFGRTMFLIVLFFAAIFIFGAVTLLSVQAQDVDTGEYFSVTTTEHDGVLLDKITIGGPPHPPAGFVIRPATELPVPGKYAAANSLTVPAYDWVFGCSSVSGSMIAGYYDRNGYTNMYSGPTDSGVMPLNNSIWGSWTDVVGAPYPNIPLAASHNGVDGRMTKGSIDDYWVSYGSFASDPYISGGWSQHAWSDTIGDYMKTSQSAYGNTDGSTSFYNYTGSATRLTCADMVTYGIETLDGTYGRKLFYQARGYTVTDCYSQNTDNTVAGGFSYAQFKAEIDAGHPVMLNLEGHTIVGVGYSDPSTVYIHDTWDYLNHSMTWGPGANYGGLGLMSVSIVNLQAIPQAPAAFNKSLPADSTNTTPTVSLSWGASTGATEYFYCVDENPATTCDTSWISVGTNTSVALPTQTSGAHYWQVYARNSIGDTYANSDTWWTFTVIPAPGAFNKIAPADSTSTTPTVNLSWGASTGATEYFYCIDEDPATTCDTAWVSAGTDTSVALPTQTGGVHYWQVYAHNSTGDTYANSDTWWTFTVMPAPAAFNKIAPADSATIL